MKSGRKYMMKIPASFPTITDEDIQAVHRAVDKGWFTEGRQCNRFGQLLNEASGTKLYQLVNSGSSSNLVAITSTAEKWSGKMILTQALAFPTTVAPIYQNGKIPVYVDTDPKTLSPDIGQIAYLVDKYGDEISGAVLTHVLGFPYDEKLVRKILGDKFLIADCCDALGGYVYDKPVGSFADASTYSFFPAHHITTGEGGAILTNDEELFKIMRSVVNWGRDCYCQPGQQNVCGKRFEQGFLTLPEGYDHKYTFTRLGYNLKMTELQAAMGVTQMERLVDIADTRADNFYDIRDRLKPFEEYLQPVHATPHTLISPFGYPVILKIKGYTDDLIRHLEKSGISTRRIFAGNITRQPGYFGLPYVKLDLENTDYLMENAFWIGVHPGVTKLHVDWIEEVFTDWFDEKGLL